MSGKCRIQKGKKWARNVDEWPWFPERLIGLFRAAAASSRQGERGALTKAIAAAESLGPCKDFQEVFEPRPEIEAEQRFQELRSLVRKKLMEEEASADSPPIGFGNVLAWMMRDIKISNCTPEQAECRIDARMNSNQVKDAMFIRTSEPFVRMPATSWTMRFGDAGLFDPNKARSAICWGQAAKELGEHLDKAMEQAEALGVEIPKWLRPGHDMPSSGASLATAKAVEFDPAMEFESKDCYAVYVEGSPHGFLDKKGKVKNDLGEACLFPSPKDAKAFASKHVVACFLVNVQASVTGCKALLGEGAIPDSLTAVMASRERREIGEALGKAEIEMLREELARRESEEAQGKPADAPRRTGRL